MEKWYVAAKKADFDKWATEEKIIAITFDDGPDPIQIPKVLKVLREKHIPACFFCIGNRIRFTFSMNRRVSR